MTSNKILKILRHLTFLIKKINSMTKPIRMPDLYFFAIRYLSIIHARKRDDCSNLNNDLFLTLSQTSPGFYMSAVQAF